MTEVNKDMERRLLEMKQSISDLRSALRRTQTMRIVGTLAGLVIAIVYAILFVNLIRTSFDPGRLVKAAQAEMRRPEFQANVNRLVSRAKTEVLPEFQKALSKKVKELELGPALGEELPRLAREVMPFAMQQAVNKAAEMKLTPMLAEEFSNLAVEVGPVYLTEAKKMAEELDLLQDFASGMKEQAGKISEAYRNELRRVAPEILTALKAQQDELAQELTSWLEGRIRAELESSMQRNAQYVQDETGLTEEVVRQKLASVVVAADDAIRGMVRQRTDKYQADLQTINEMLKQVPECKEKDPAMLEDEMGRVLVQLLKMKLPEYKSPLEWGEGK
jgi:hypothetical protein